MARPRDVELNHRGMADLLRSDGAQNVVEREADQVATRARGRGVTVEGDIGQVSVPIEVVRARSTRARALVSIQHPAGEAIEAKRRLLGGALG